MSSCDCDPPACFTEVWRRARKEHQCYECGDAIRPGDRYVHASGIWDGHPDSFKTCEPCSLWKAAYGAFARMSDGGFCECIQFGRLWEEIGEVARELNWAWDKRKVAA